MRPWLFFSLAWIAAALAGGLVSLILLWGFIHFDSGQFVSASVANRLLTTVQILVAGVVFLAAAWGRGPSAIEQDMSNGN